MAEDTSKKNDPYLDQKSTEELRAILRASALSEEAGDPELVDHILEVIMSREETNDFSSVEQARKDFDKFYRDLDRPLYPTEDDNRSSPAARRTEKKRVRYILVAAAIVAALVALTCVPVLGHVNIIHMVAYWTAEQFGFQLPEDISGAKTRSEEREVPADYQELQTVMEQFNSELVIPGFPEDFEMGEPVLQYPSEFDMLYFSVMYQKQDDFFIFTVVQNDGQLKNGSSYEKNDPDAECYEYDGIEYYILSNDENYTASWCIGKTEYFIVTNVSISDLKDVLKSAYKV